MTASTPLQPRSIEIAKPFDVLCRTLPNATACESNKPTRPTLTFAIDLWNLTFPVPGDYTFRILVDGSERKRLPLAISQLGVGPMMANARLDA